MHQHNLFRTRIPFCSVIVLCFVPGQAWHVPNKHIPSVWVKIDPSSSNVQLNQALLWSKTANFREEKRYSTTSFLPECTLGPFCIWYYHMICIWWHLDKNIWSQNFAFKAALISIMSVMPALSKNMACSRSLEAMLNLFLLCRGRVCLYVSDGQLEIAGRGGVRLK